LFLQRWIFYINFFFLGASVVLVVLFLAMLLSLLTESYDFNRAPVTNQGMKTKKDGLFDEERKIGDFAMKGCRARKCTKIKIAKEEVPRVARAAVQTVQVSQVLIHGIP
jgi:hypothetical protein